MKFEIRNIVVATVLAVSAGGALAQQLQHYGRDSVYANPGHAAGTVVTGTNLDRFGRDSVFADQPQTGSATALNWDSTSATRFGRDSVYATQPHGSSTAVATNVPGLQPFGRDSVYAILWQSPAGEASETKIGAASPK